MKELGPNEHVEAVIAKGKVTGDPQKDAMSVHQTLMALLSAVERAGASHTVLLSALVSALLVYGATRFVLKPEDGANTLERVINKLIKTLQRIAANPDSVKEMENLIAQAEKPK